MKVRDWVMLKLYKNYSILLPVRVTKKLSQQYVGPFLILKKIGCLAYKLKVPNNWKIYPVFSVAQLEPAPAPSKDPFHWAHPQQHPFIFVEGDTNRQKSFKVDYLFNKRMVKKSKGLTIKYLVRWTGYSQE